MADTLPQGAACEDECNGRICSGISRHGGPRVVAATGPAARTIADVETLQELQSVEPIHVDKRWAVRVGLADGGADAGPWKLLYCLADFPPEKNAEPALPPLASELSGAMGSLGPVLFTVDDPAVLQNPSSLPRGDVMTERGLNLLRRHPDGVEGRLPHPHLEVGQAVAG